VTIVAAMSPQLIAQLSTSCKKMDSGTIGQLGAAVQSGQLPWFVRDFRSALDGGFTIEGWRAITQLDIADGDKTKVEQQARTVWTAVAPNEPFPGMRWS
jgi:hypothetical protein